MSIGLFYYIVLLLVVWLISISAGKKKKKSKATRSYPKRAKTSSVPNRPRQISRTKEERDVRVRTQASRAKCNFEAAYSKGKPGRVGLRGDYDPVTPQGMTRIRCMYCNAENFVPTGSREHYHCYFCWEKL